MDQNNGNVVEATAFNLTSPKSQTEPETVEYEVIPYEPPPPPDPSKTGNKPKQLKAVEVWGFEVGRGMKKRIVNPDDVYGLAAIGCSDSEIARWFDLAESTLKYNFSEILAKGREDVKMTLRRAMLKNALNGNAVMQIWLSKNLLGMSDNPTNNEDNKPLPWNEDSDSEE
jgi:hypothetical protein